jgi:hypothetical protein
MNIHHSGDSQELVINLYPRVWSKLDRTFVRDSGNFEGLFIQERLNLPKLSKSPKPGDASAQPGLVIAEPAVEVATDMSLSNKKFSYRFMTLPYHTQISIMKRFALANDSEIESIPDIDLFVSCFERATQRGVLDEVWSAVEDAEKKTEA